MQNITTRSLLRKTILFSLMLHIIVLLVIPKFGSGAEYEPTLRDLRFFLEEMSVIKEDALTPTERDEIEGLFLEGPPDNFVTPASTTKSIKPGVISPRLDRSVLADYINREKAKESQDKEPKQLTKEELKMILKQLEKDMELRVLAGDSYRRIPTQSVGTKKRYIDIVRDQIEEQYFIPPKARVHKMRGSVVLKMTVSARGEINKLIFLEHSDFPILDMAAKAAIERAAPFPDISDKVDLDYLDIIVPFVFKPE